MRILALCLLFLMPLAAQAQDDQSDRGFIQGILEDALSAPGRDVRIKGFAGALSSRATIDEISVTDANGVWFSATGVSLTWNRSALLSKQVLIDEIAIDRIELPRRPLPAESELPTAEARGTFSLPELPVSVDIKKMTIGRAVIGAAVFGEAAEIAFSGKATLANGAGSADLAINRLDQEGRFTIVGAYDNATRALEMAVDLTEPADGLAANLLNLPGLPSVEMKVQGADPINDFTAELSLDTDGQRRLSGEVTLLSDPEGDTVFALDLGGDIAPVFVPEFAEFLGNQVGLQAKGARMADGTLTLDQLRVEAAALTLTGAAEIGADGWPRKLALDGEIAPPEGETILLPMAGAATSVTGVALTGAFDAAAGDTWSLAGRAQGLARDTIQIETLGFDGSGVLSRDSESLSGTLQMDASGLAPADAALARAIGDRLRGVLHFGWSRSAPLRLSELNLTGEDYGLAGTLVVSGLEGEDDLTLVPDVQLNAQDLARFADLAGIELDGAADLGVTGRVAPLTGVMALQFDGTTETLTTGIAQLDPLLAGTGKVSLGLGRDETGLRVDPVVIRTDHARIDATALLRTGASKLDLTARVAEIALVLPDLQGAAEVTATAEQANDVWNLTADATLPGGTGAQYRGTVTGDGRDKLEIAGRLSANVTQLATFSAIAGRPLGGAVSLVAEGRGDLVNATFDLRANGSTTNPRFDVPVAEALLPGTTTFDIAATRDAAGEVVLKTAVIDGREVTARASGAFGPDSGKLELTTRIANLARALPDLPGAASLTGTAIRTGEVWTLKADATLPGDTGANFSGTFTGDGKSKLLADGRLQARVARLGAFSSLAGRPLSGAANLTATGTADILAGSFDLVADGSVRNPGFGVPTIEPLLRGTSQIDLSVARDGNGRITIRQATVDAPGVDADVSGAFGAGNGDARFRIAIPNLGPLVPDLPGPASFSGTATQQGESWRIDASGNGPGGIEVSTQGRVAADVSRLDLSANGLVPLALANRRLNGQALSGLVRFNLAVNGPPQLSSVSGRLSLADAQVALLAQGMSIDAINGQIDLNGAAAQVALNSQISSGGQLRVAGPVALTPPYNADLEAQLRNVVLRSAALYEAQLDGRMTMSGPLLGGARIGGGINIATAELRIPDLGPSYSALDGLQHINPSADVQRTLRFAGLDQSDEDTASAAPDYPLDVIVRAPNRLFVRGRGLDAELGGELRLTGTTNNVVPVGSFSLIRGRLDLLGRRLTLTQGDVQLRGSFDPVIAFEATTEVDDFAVTLALAGLASAPELTVTSVPELPQDEALSLFLFGRDVTSISALQAVQLAAAIRTLSGQGGLGIGQQLREGLGVDELDISTDSEGNAQASVGKYLSDNIYTDVTVSSDGSSQINLNLDLTPSVTVRGRVGSDGDTGVGVFFERDY
ncbi:translocation/assembly module TamB domain-containing protein [Marinovum sp. 2_MG-2023]|uniref:translocation/assembly module TamB domain-containing protein n=1 Tax=unclassified Marinovum TaxID=2647166 RepID=UPI0026E2E459|nr:MULTISPECIES: translocation/assembly module TamB domain-containing protein [unclassified Marinovum]MDO6732412.1 translocation/assembly module TamB domain-containing protein [Marinovum sp. 2_MG-2023]MDO6781755.1 translocation/assembly module TamB domain-containing protein [Marinovum sp. 1_MG-2023]